MTKVVVVVGIIVYLIYGATHWSLGEHKGPLVPVHQDNQLLHHLDTTWQQGPCGHWVSPAERRVTGPCILV